LPVQCLNATYLGGAVSCRVCRFADAQFLDLPVVQNFLLLKKLASYPKQNGLAKTLREIGRIERTLFMLDWFLDPALRRRVQAGLNKGEARNALARAVFMHRLGEIRDCGLENQSYRASGLTLLTAAITLWNTVYIENAINLLKNRAYISMISCCHIYLRWAGSILI
jgi:TnpA family transposase